MLDPFVGSGTTGVAALNTGREFIGVEMSAHYIDVAAQRLAATNVQDALDFGGIT